MIVLAECKILMRRANDNFEWNPYCDFRKVSYRYTDQEVVLCECEHLPDLGVILLN